jgi:hypothetical protein
MYRNIVNLDRKEAITFLNLDEKVFDNYFKFADEFQCEPRYRGGRYYFNFRRLCEWKEQYNWRTTQLRFQDYQLCLDFALAQHFRGYVLSDWGTARQREFGQKITNWIKGQLAEVAVKNFFNEKFNFEIDLDFDIHEQIVPQDIIMIEKNGVKREPNKGVGIKSSKPKSAYLVLSENEVLIEDRKSDIYIFCRPNMPDDHLLRLTREKIIETVEDQQHFSSYKEDIPFFENIFCEIAGWCKLEELEKVTEIPGQDFGGYRYVKKSGHLHKDQASWEELISLL